MKGQIVKIISNHCTVSTENKEYICTIRGKFRKENISPVVGDYVLFDEDKKVIEKIEKRKNYLIRPVVANIDQAFIVTSLREPDLSLNLLDKLLVWMNINKIKPIICLTKKDKCSKTELEQIKDIISYYINIGYDVIYNDELDKIKKMIAHKTSVFTGQTGAGKSTLLNKLNPSLELKTGEISKALNRGRHTTRHVELIDMFDGKVLDTPGFSSLDFNKYTKEDIKNAFIEFRNYPCIYKDCMHIDEKECSIKENVDKGLIKKSRYDNYKNIIDSIESRW